MELKAILSKFCVVVIMAVSSVLDNYESEWGLWKRLLLLEGRRAIDGVEA